MFSPCVNEIKCLAQNSTQHPNEGFEHTTAGNESCTLQTEVLFFFRNINCVFCYWIKYLPRKLCGVRVSFCEWEHFPVIDQLFDVFFRLEKGI